MIQLFFLMVKRNNFFSCDERLLGSRRNSQMKFLPEFSLNWNPATFKVLGVMFSIDLHQIVPINFQNKLNEMKKVLTPFGKITNQIFGHLQNNPLIIESSSS